jgi:hypothetical protein
MRFCFQTAAILALSLASSWEIPAQTSSTSQNPPSPPLSSNQNVITNSDVEGMIKAGLAPEIVAAKVKNSNCKCDTSPAALAELKAAGVPDNVILAMVQTTAVPVEKPSGLIDIRNAKTVYLLNQSTDFKAFGHLRGELKKWGRWTIVERPEDADLQLVFSATRDYVGSINSGSVSGGGGFASGFGTSTPIMNDQRFLIAVDRASQRQLMGVGCERRLGAEYTAGVLVNRMKKQIEKPE